jgi:hypothetical protein
MRVFGPLKVKEILDEFEPQEASFAASLAQSAVGATPLPAPGRANEQQVILS